MSATVTRTWRSAVVVAVVVLAGLGGAHEVRAQDGAAPDERGGPSARAAAHAAAADALFRDGQYLRASEEYRLALLEAPGDPALKLAFGETLFAIGNYSYSAYALRRGVAQVAERRAQDAPPLLPRVAARFPTAEAFAQAQRDLMRYVTVNPRDAGGLTVLAYVLLAAEGERSRCRGLLTYLKRLDPDDAFATFLLAELERADAAGPDGTAPQEPPPAPAPRKRPAGEKACVARSSPVASTLDGGAR